MPLGPLMLDIAGTNLDKDDIELLRRPGVGGVILFARNFANLDQLRQLVKAIRATRQELLLAVDQEGGRVQRFKEGFTRLPAMQRLGNLLNDGDKAEALPLIKDCGWLMAAEVMACGVDFSFAPVLDIDDHSCDVIADRSFSADPGQVVLAARAFIEGMHEAGMAATGKHFPGHGGVKADSHMETPIDTRALAELKQRDLQPFTALVDQLNAIMPAHIVFPEVDSKPVGFSAVWLQQILRKGLGFDGVIFSDDLSMKGADLVGGYADKAQAAMDAGCDMVLVCNNRAGAIEALDYLESRGLEENPRLRKMAMRQGSCLTQLQTDTRWLRAREGLKQLLYE